MHGNYQALRDVLAKNHYNLPHGDLVDYGTSVE